MGWLRRNFNVPKTWIGKRLILHFEAVAGDCIVLINGKQVSSHFDAYLPFDVDVTNFVKKGNANELLVGIRHRNLFNKKNAKYKYLNATYPPGSNTSDLVGIWQDVFLQALPPVRIDSIFVKPNVNKNELEFDIKLINQTNHKTRIRLNGQVKEWLNLAVENDQVTAEIRWGLGNTALTLISGDISLAPDESKHISLKIGVNGRLKFWCPDSPRLYTLVLNLTNGFAKEDCKTERFGWRSFEIKDKFFYLNRKKIQCFGDLQHPFGPYICSRRFAWAWYKMIKDVGGNAVRLHAQPWPRVYYDLAGEMGLLVLDEGALFGSSISLNLEEAVFWERAAQHIDHLVLRDRNHPSVVGWSVGNEMFAIALLNKPTPEVAKKWINKVAKLAKRPLAVDPTRSFVTSDGDQDIDGQLPVWSKHLGHGLKLNLIPDINKPIVVGESGATYYGKPKELFPFIGIKAYASYYNRNEALAIDAYQNVVKMARPLLAWYSPSEICWFGIEHLNLGYHEYSRLPNLQDGIFPGLPYEEGKPGYQFERIPPYVTTFNPGLDPSLPVYKPLPMFYALKAALAKNGPQPSPWDHFQDTIIKSKPSFPQPIFTEAYFAGKLGSRLVLLLDSIGIRTTQNKNVRLIIIDGENITDEEMKGVKPIIENIQHNGGQILIMIADKAPSQSLRDLMPNGSKVIKIQSTALQSNAKNFVGHYFNLRDLYFSEMAGDKEIIKEGFVPEGLNKVSVVFEPAKTDWSLFNNIAENRKCAQVVLYEHLQKQKTIAMFTYTFNKCTIAVSTIDYNILNQETIAFWRNLFSSLGVKHNDFSKTEVKSKKKHNLLLDGPVN